MPPDALASRIDHTDLKPETPPAKVAALVDEAVEHGFAAVCVNGVHVAGARARLNEKRGLGAHSVRLCSVAAFPLGASTAIQRAMEATGAVKAGCEEIDVVAWLPRLIEQDHAGLRQDLVETVRAVRAANSDVIVKVILETAALRAAAEGDDAWEAMIAAGCAACAEAGCDFVKTATGFHSAGGATVDAVRLLRKHAGPMRVKASGGIRTYDDAAAMIDAGADRIGTSSGVSIVAGAKA